MSAVTTPRCPAELFANCWKHLHSVTSGERIYAMGMPTPAAAAAPRLRELLDQSDGADVVGGLAKILYGVKDPIGHLCVVARVMIAIDNHFLLIHPRMPKLPVGMGLGSGVPQWLQDANELRGIVGHYWSSSTHRLVARGPLTREARKETASGTDRVEDMFAALALTPTQLKNDGTTVEIVHKVVSRSHHLGVEPSSTPGSEHVVFVPVAERSADLSATCTTRSAQQLIDFTCNVDPAARILDVIGNADPADILLAPEFVVPESAADALAAGLTALGRKSPRILVAGSGPTSSRTGRTNRPLNESRVLNRTGVSLWRQQKIALSWVAGDRAHTLGYSKTATGIHFENTDSSTELFVVDIDGLGRCVTLICQDLRANSLANDVIQTYQPDWVFVPVLDIPLADGRWSDRTSRALAEHSHARFLVCNSSAWGHTVSPSASSYACGMAMGSFDALKDHNGKQLDAGRQLAFIDVTLGKSVAYGSIRWRSMDSRWRQFVCGSQPNPPPAATKR